VWNTVFTTSTFTSTDPNYHSDNETYWYDFEREFQLVGYSGVTWQYPTQTSFKFVCTGGVTTPCRFP
jgi:hypothetical protein